MIRYSRRQPMSQTRNHDLLFVTSAVICYIWSWFIVCDIDCRLLYMIMIYCWWHRLSSDIYHHDFIVCDIGCRLLYWSWFIVCDIACHHDILFGTSAVIMIYCLWHRLSSAIYDYDLLFVTSLLSAMYDHDLHSTSFLINLFGMEFLLFCQCLLKYWRF